jgi:Brp/Blh family beta-carotene 15,15'-monooxygenase
MGHSVLWLAQVAVTLLVVLLAALPGAAPWMQGVLLGLVLLVGIPHGAADLALWQHLTMGAVDPARPSFAALRAYLVAVACSAGLFLGVPALSALVFLVGSAWHFGEGEFWPEGPPGPRASARRRAVVAAAGMLMWGACVPGLLILWHPHDAAGLFAELGWAGALPVARLVGVRLGGWIFACGVVAVCAALLVGVAGARSRAQTWRTMATTGLLVWAFGQLDLVSAFALYFVVWHAAPSVLHQARALDPVSGLGTWLRAAGPWAVLAVVGVLGLAAAGPRLPVSFPGLLLGAALILTPPHLVVMSLLALRVRRG